MTNKVGRELWNVHQAAEFLNMKEITIYKKCKKIEIPHMRIGGKRTIRFDPVILEELIGKQREGE